jgi:hypothetical protein
VVIHNPNAYGVPVASLWNLLVVSIGFDFRAFPTKHALGKEKHRWFLRKLRRVCINNPNAVERALGK